MRQQRRQKWMKDKIGWRRMVCILSREGAALRVSGFFFQAVLQAVMLFIPETWVATPCMGNDLGGGGGGGGSGPGGKTAYETALA